MEQGLFYGVDRVIEIMQKEGKGWLFYVGHNTPELFDEYIEYCTDSKIDPTEEDSAKAFVDYREQVFDESFENDNEPII